METDLQEKIDKLIAENKALQETLLKKEKKVARKAKNTKRALSWSWKLFAGNSLHKNFNQWFSEFHSDKKVSATTSANLLTSIVRRFVRVQMVSLLLLVFTLIPSLVSIYILYNQNKLIQTQNSLVEASRNSSYGFQLSAVFDAVDKARKVNKSNNTITLNKNIIGRIVGLTQSLKPYKTLEDSKLSEKPYSPEKTQLLLFLLNANISNKSLNTVFASADFSHCDLRNANLSKKYMVGINLRNSNLENADMNSSILNEADLSGANLQNIQFSHGSANEAIFDNANLTNAKITRTYLTNVNFSNAVINNAVIEVRK